jgi:hypothetical protein
MSFIEKSKFKFWINQIFIVLDMLMNKIREIV